jgi:aminomethyltransferase
VAGLAHTPLLEEHRKLGARIVEFAGFEMPVQYSSIKQEHAAVRERAGIFDVSHMGQLHLEGPGAVEAAERLVSCVVETLGVGRVRYGILCNEDGGCVDDVTIYRGGGDSIMLCVNAANIEKDEAWIREHTYGGVEVSNRSEETGLLALQGPESSDVLEKLMDDSSCAALGALGRFRFDRFMLGDIPALISRTGYTGSDGFELYLPAGRTVDAWQKLLETGEPLGLEPAGLGARDTLRLEAALPLYGHELDDTTSPLEAGLDRFVKRKRGGYIGAEAIEKREADGRERQLVGFEMDGRGIARADYPIAHSGKEVGRVTSGSPSPTLGKSIGLGYVPPRLAETGTGIDVVVRGKAVAAKVVETPFV